MTRWQNLAGALLGGLLVLAATPARAGDRPFRGIADLTVTDVRQVEEGLLVAVRAEGRGDPLDEFVGEGTFLLTPSGQLRDGAVALRGNAEYGDGVILEFEAELLDDGGLVGAFRITNGIGLFKFAEGRGRLVGTFDDVITIAFDGRVRLP